MSLPLEDIQCYEELVTECDIGKMSEKPLDTEADCPETGLKTVNWRERVPYFMGLCQKKAQTMSRVSLAKSLASDKTNSQFSAEVPRAIDLSVVPAISTDKMPEPSLTITKAQGKTTKNRRERSYFPSCCLQKEQKKDKRSSVSTLSDKAMFVDNVYQDLLQEKGSAIKLCQSVEQLHLAVEECSAERLPHLLGLSKKKPETMSRVSLTKSLASENNYSQEDVQEFQATLSQCTVARTSSPVELISNGSVHSIMNACLLKVEENSVESVLELHQAAGEFSAEVPRAIDLSVVPAISTDKMPEPSLTITKAQGKTTKNRRERSYFPSCCLQKEQKKAKVNSVSTLSDKAMFVDNVYQDLLQEKGSAIKLCQSVEQLHLAVEECSAERLPHLLGLSKKKPETMSRVSLTKSLASENNYSQEDVQEFQATLSQCTVARTSSPVELISNGSVHSIMNACLLKVEENSVESVLELHQAAGEFSAEVPRAIDLSVFPAISTDKMPEPSLTITKAQGKTTKNRRERSYFPSCCLQKEQKKDKGSSISTLSDKAMFVDNVYQDLLQEKGSAIKLCQSVEQLHLAVEECSAERLPHLLGLSKKKPETMSRVSLTKSLASEKNYSQEDVQEFQATLSQCTVARTSSPVELTSNGSVHSIMNACLLKVEENSVESVLELHQAAGEFSAEVPRAIDLSMVPAISTDKMPEPSLTITKAQGKTTKNRRERSYSPSCCLQKEQKKDKGSSISTLSDKAMFVDNVYQDLLQEKGSAINLCQSVEQLHLAVEECSAERLPHLLGLSKKKPETMSRVNLTKSLASENNYSQEDVQEFQATLSQCTVARTSSPVELISNGSVHSIINSCLLKVEENSVESVLELHQAAGEFSAEVPRAIDLSVVPAISTDKMPEPSLTITKAQGKTTKNRRERFYFPSCCLQKEQKKAKVNSVSTLSDKAMFVDNVYQDLLQEKGSAIKLCQSVEQLHLAVEECSAERLPHLLGLSKKKPETMSRVSLTKSLASENNYSQEDVHEFQATLSQCTVARTSSPVEFISNGSVHSIMNACLLKVEENSVESVLELHQAAGEFSAEVPRAIDLSVFPAISTDKMPEPSLTITKAQGKTTKNRRERSYFPSCCLQKEQKKDKGSSISTLSDKAMFVDNVYQDLLQEKGSAINLCQSVEQLHLAVEECSAERLPHLLGLSKKKPETMSRVSLTKSLASENNYSQEDVQEFQATLSQCTVARTSSPVELISNGSVHSIMNACLLKVEENSVESVLELHQAAGEFSAEVPRAIDLSVFPAISTDKMPEPSLTITKAQGKTTKNRRERFYFPSCCPQKAQSKAKGSSISTLSDKAMFVDNVYQDLLQEKGSAIKLCQSVEQLHLAVEECSAERLPHLLGLSKKKPETMSRVSLTKSLASENNYSQEDVQEFQATLSQCTVARTSSPVELISNGSVHSIMNACLLKVEENSVESVLELHQAAGEFSAEFPRAIDLSVVPAISTDKMPEPSLTITKAQGKTTKNRRERFYFPSCCPLKAQKKAKVSSVSTLSDNAKFVDDVYQDLLQKKGSGIKLCQSVEQLHLAVEECSSERIPHYLGLSQKKPKTMSRVSLAKSLDSDKTTSQEDIQEFQANSSLSMEARTLSPVELLSNGSVHSVMNALLSKVKENSVESVLELHQAGEEFSAEVPKAIALSVVQAISTDKMPEPSLTITKAQGKTTKNRGERFYFPSCCPQKEQKKDIVSSISTLSDKAMFFDDVYQDLLQEKGSAIKLCQSVEQLHLAVDECSTEVPKAIALSVARVISVEKMAESSLNTIAQGKQTNNRQERSYFPSFCLQKKKKQNNAEQSFTSTLSNKANSSGPQEVLPQVCGSATPSLCNTTETQSTATGTPSTPVVFFSSGSVHSLVCALLLKIRKNADGAPPQSEPELIEKALSVSGSVLTLLAEVNGMSVDEESSTPSRAPPDEVVEAVYKDLLQEKGSAIKLHQAVEQCSAEVPKVIAWSLVKEISTAPPNEFLAAPAFLLSSVLLLSGHPSKAISLSGNAKSLVSAASDSLPKDESQKRFGLLPKLPKTHKMQKMPKLKAKNKVDPLAISFDLLREDPLEDTYDHS
ncbi:uncharacterized protein [Salmo salar]|uniref:Uncharacterized protein n=1 Tax=Salmo salar TaxID=8030 RepID=A0ABM3D064_SALSA|nr:uncharacterized protein LOC106572498 [Salmo salar]